MPKMVPASNRERHVVERRLRRLRVAEAHRAELDAADKRLAHARPAAALLGQLVDQRRDRFDRELRFVVLLQQVRQLDQRRRHARGQHDEGDERTDIHLVVAGDRQVNGEGKDAAGHYPLEQVGHGLDDVADLAFLEAHSRRRCDPHVPFVTVAEIQGQRLDRADPLQGLDEKGVLGAFSAEHRAALAAQDRQRDEDP